jgi:predicted acylesterase/phospholipase RssA
MAEESTQTIERIFEVNSQEAQRVHLTQGDGENISVGLALSGGGFRATLFHLGAIEYLRHIGRLKDIKTITSVSGGSVLAAHLVLNWEKYNGTDEEFNQARNQMLDFIKRDLRSYIIRRHPITVSIGSLVSAVRKIGFDSLAGKLNAWLPSSNTRLLADYYHKHLLQKKSLSKLTSKARPTLRILVTNLTRIGDNSFFDSNGYHVQHADGQQVNAQCPLVPIGIAVAASSAFPAVFEALEITPQLLSVRNIDLNPTRQFLTDGGAFDNLGLHQLLSEHKSSPFHCLIVSDASGGNDIDVDTDYRWLFPRLTRVSNILYRQVNELQKDRAQNNPRLLIFDIRTTVESETGLSPHVQRRLEFIRTDLDIFSPHEMHCILGHGYNVARHIVEANADLLRLDNRLEPKHSKWQNIPDYQEIEDEQLLSLINEGTKRKLRLFSIKDWIIWLYLILTGLLIASLIWFASAVIAPHWKSFTTDSASKATMHEASIGPFLIKPGQEFRSALGSAKKNFYFVGLTNYYTLSNHKEVIADAIKRNVNVKFYLYLPRESEPTDPNQIRQETFNHYIEVYKRYRPHGDNYIEALSTAWRYFDPSFSAYGSISSPPSQEAIKQHFGQFFYHEEPKGWLVVIDAEEPSFASAQQIYWFPYLSEAKEIDRPGLKLSSASPIGKETLKWLKKLVEDEGTRPVTNSETDKWRAQIMDLVRRNQPKAQAP